MKTRFGNVLLIVALLATTGSHWAVLQTVAWSGMLITNLRSGSFTEAVERTFNGKHPCTLCRGIAAAKDGEKKSAFLVLQVKQLEFVCEKTPIVFTAPQQFTLPPECLSFTYDLTRKPSVPPPRPICA